LKRTNRRGTATVEFAVCLPVLVALFIGVNETCSAIFLKQQVTVAAYEGARVGIQRQSTDELVEQRILEILDERGITYNAETVVNISTPGFGQAAALEHVTTTVTVPIAGNSLTGGVFSNQNISASVVLRKEFQNN